jgi:hypothetical protein
LYQPGSHGLEHAAEDVLLLVSLDSSHSFPDAIRSAQQVEVVAAASAAGAHSCFLVHSGTEVAPVVGAGAVEEAAVVSSGHATVGGFEGLARPASVAAEEALGHAAGVQVTMMRFQHLGRIAAILLVVEGLVEELGVQAHYAAVALIVPAVPLRRRLAGLLGSQTR